MKTRLEKIQAICRLLDTEIGAYLKAAHEIKQERISPLSDGEKAAIQKHVRGKRLRYEDLHKAVRAQLSVGSSKAKAKIRAMVKSGIIEQVGIPRSKSAYYRLPVTKESPGMDFLEQEAVI